MTEDSQTQADPMVPFYFYKIFVVFNLIYYWRELSAQLGIFDLMPIPLDSPAGINLMLSFIPLVLNVAFLLLCLAINHWSVVALYAAAMIIELLVYLLTEHPSIWAYSAWQTIWGGVVVALFLWHQWVAVVARQRAAAG
jgi:hypothetical protein